MKTKNQTGLKNFEPNIKLNHNIYLYIDLTSLPTFGPDINAQTTIPPQEVLFLAVHMSLCDRYNVSGQSGCLQSNASNRSHPTKFVTSF